jgi:cytochrome c oxidase subunit 3
MAGSAHAPGEQKHPFHLVDPSPWPLLGSIAGGALATGAVLYFHGYGAWLMIVGLLFVLATMFLWWRDVIRESNSGLYHNPIVAIGLRYGMALFIASEVMFFVAFFWAYFDFSLFPRGGVWPPEGIKTFDPFHLPLLNTLILLLSGCTLTWAHHALLHNDRKGLIQGLICTVLLGVSFTGLQVVEYSHAAFGFRDGIYSSTFYMATGFHGFHVLVGTLFLAVCLFRALRGGFTAEKHVGFEAAAWYWHFVDVVWLFLFVCIYWLGAGELAAH